MNRRERLVIRLYAHLVRLLAKKLEDHNVKREIEHGLVILDNELREESKEEGKS